MRPRLLLLAALAGAACGEPPAGDPTLTLAVSVSPTPATLGAARILMTLSDEAGEPLEGAMVVVTGRRPSGGSVTDTAGQGAPGRYVVGSFPFDTRGDWTLEARARLGDGRVAATDHAILVVGPPPGR